MTRVEGGKIGKESLRVIIKKYPTTSSVAIGKELGVDHTTILYWVKKLRAAGFNLKKNRVEKLSINSRKIVDELKVEFGVNGKKRKSSRK